ncbi:MAG TPA: PKD domain-containing protein [Phycisphaerae bacterium]|nr:PKD domain-containing protein [Phycisphaerae bacterium]
MGQSCGIPNPAPQDDQVAGFHPQNPSTQPSTNSTSGNTTINPASSTLTADAGPDLVVDENSAVTLDGSASVGVSGTLYSWTQTTGSPLMWQKIGEDTIEFTAPEVTQDTELVFALTLTSGSTSVSDVVKVLVKNVTPIVSPIITELAVVPAAVEGDAPLNVTYSLTTVDGQELPEGKCSWIFDDNSTSEGDEVAHTFLKPGIYVVSACLFIGPSLTTQVGCSQGTAVVRYPAPKLNVVTALNGGSATVTMTCISQPAADLQIRYTLDGSVPSRSSSLYMGSFILSKSAQVTARVFPATADADERIASPLASASVVVIPQVVNPPVAPPATPPVAPGRLAVSPPDVISCSGPEGGPFGPAANTQVTYTLTNPGGTAIEWSASTNVSWLTISSSSGFLDPGGAIPAHVAMSINQAEAGKLVAGSHTGAVTFTNVTNGNGNDTRMAYVTVNATPTVTVSIATGTEGETKVGTVTRTGSTASALTVNLSVNAAYQADLTVPATVTIPAGQASATFNAVCVDDISVEGTEIASVTATASGYTSGSAAMAITDNDLVAPALTLAIADGTEGQTKAGTVTRTGSTASALTVNLSVNAAYQADLTVPATVTIPAGQASATFNAVCVDDISVEGTETATVMATVAGYSSGSAAVTITDNDSAPNLAPIVSAGPNKYVVLPANSVTLSGAMTDDRTPNPPAALTATWSKVSGPGTVSFANASAASTSASFSAAGTYVLQLTGNDGVLTTSSAMTVFVIPVLTIQASATSGAAPLDVTFAAREGAGLATTIPTGSTLTWSFGDGSAAETGPLTTHVQRNHRYTVVGTRTVALSLNLAGGLGTVALGTLGVEVTSGNNLVPLANAGPDQSLNDEDDSGAEQVMLTAAASSDADGLITSYKWSKGATTLVESSSSGAVVTLAKGTHVVTLTVTDNQGASASDSATITVNDVFASSLSQWGITWTFDKRYRVGKFVNGDWWVKGPVTVTAIDPPSVTVGGRIMNGSMLDPSALNGATQGYDSAMYREYGPAYSPALNVALGLSPGSPRTVPANSSLVSTISVNPLESSPNALQKQVLLSASVLTVTTGLVGDGSFRPPYSGSDKSIRFTRAQLDYSRFANLAPVSGTPDPDGVRSAAFQRVCLDHVPNWMGADYSHHRSGVPGYGREFSSAVGTGYLLLNLNVAPEKKERLLIDMVQAGIDLYGVLVNGGQDNWVGQGGEASGRFPLILLAGVVLHDAAMTNVGQLATVNGGPYRFGELEQTFYVTQVDIDRLHNSYGSPQDDHGVPFVQYTQADLGMPEWGITHVVYPNTDNKSWDASYRRCCTANSWAGYILGSRIMGIRGLWRHDAIFDYQDRYMTTETVHEWTRSWDRPFTENMWDTYRGAY